MPNAPKRPSVVAPSSRWPLRGWGSVDWIRAGLFIDTEFWSRPETWPHDPAGYVFLARAVDEIGKAMFGVHWTGKEWTTPLTPDMDPSLIARGAAVQQEIATLCEAGKLVFGLRPISGGAITDGRPDLWNTEPRYFRSRFYRCQMDAEDPSRAVAMSPRNSWIFVKRDTIEEQLAGHPFASRPSPVDVHLSSPPSPDEVHLSPYLRTMLQVIREMRIDPDNQSTKKKVVAALRTAWSKRFSHLGTLSENLCDHMATLVREPESQRGRGAKKKNLSKPIKD